MQIRARPKPSRCILQKDHPITKNMVLAFPMEMNLGRNISRRGNDYNDIRSLVTPNEAQRNLKCFNDFPFLDNFLAGAPKIRTPYGWGVSSATSPTDDYKRLPVSSFDYVNISSTTQFGIFSYDYLEGTGTGFDNMFGWGSVLPVIFVDAGLISSRESRTIRTNGPGGGAEIGGVELFANRWHHACISNTNGQQRVYLDGLLMAQSTNTGAYTVSDNYSMFGRAEGITGGRKSIHVATYLWNRILTHKEIATVTSDPWIMFRPTRKYASISMSNGMASAALPQIVTAINRKRSRGIVSSLTQTYTP